ncbi:nitroreductase family protein [Microbacterium sp.]|uniref:nitroreductase family protein n=1 Tax=Microbacterium sp. TaxID=51671 RepID=UPI0039E71205
MSAPLRDRTAPTEHPVLDVLDVLAGRWSPRAFDKESTIDEATLAAVLEAARWSPSAGNTQPWRFVVARRGTALHAQIVEALTGLNQTWAPAAGVLIVALAEEHDADGNPLRFAQYDLGQAVAHLSVQAHSEGLVVHQMGGIVREALSALPGVEARFVPLTVIALGQLGDAASLPDKLREREVAPRVRRPLAETVVAAA